VTAIQGVAPAITAALAAIVAAPAAAAKPSSAVSLRKRKRASSLASKGGLNLYGGDEETEKEGAREEDLDV
jgi:hypothetical protein